MQAVRLLFVMIMLFPCAAVAVEPEVHVIVDPYGMQPATPETGTGQADVPAPMMAPNGQVETLQAVFPIDSLVDWVQAKGKFKKIPAIKAFRELEVTVGFARVEFTYAGGIEALVAGLEQEDMTLMQQGPDWILKK